MQVSLLPEETQFIIELVTKYHSTQPEWVAKHLVEKLITAQKHDKEMEDCKHDIQDYVGKAKMCTHCGACMEHSWTIKELSHED